VKIKSVLCPVDFSRESPKVLRAAVTIAERERARLTVLHVLDPLLAQAARIEFERGLLETGADDDLRALIVEATTGTGVDAATVDREVRIGPADVEILMEASEKDADLVVIGTHGLSGIKRMFFGSTAARVLAQSTRPVLALPPDENAAGEATIAGLPLTRLLVAVDFTDVCMKSVHEAAKLARHWNVSLTLLHAVPAGPRLERWKSFLDADRDRRIALARYRLDMLAQDLSRGADREPQLTVTVVARGGSPEDAIACVAAEQPGTLIVMGLRERGMLTPSPGSTAYRVLCMTSAPVLILPVAAAALRDVTSMGAAAATRRP
jgi:nucleotide-binding universal stress UspA family protein